MFNCLGKQLHVDGRSIGTILQPSNPKRVIQFIKLPDNSIHLHPLQRSRGVLNPSSAPIFSTRSGNCDTRYCADTGSASAQATP